MRAMASVGSASARRVGSGAGARPTGSSLGVGLVSGSGFVDDSVASEEAVTAVCEDRWFIQMNAQPITESIVKVAIQKRTVLFIVGCGVSRPEAHLPRHR